MSRVAGRMRSRTCGVADGWRGTGPLAARTPAVWFRFGEAKRNRGGRTARVGRDRTRPQRIDHAFRAKRNF